jgi:hypothetical protein
VDTFVKTLHPYSYDTEQFWRDKNGNGKQDSSEPGWSGINVDLLTCGGKLLASTKSDSNGAYKFGSLGAGRYKIAVKAPANSKFSPKLANGPDNSDIDPKTGQSRCTDITSAGENRKSFDIGLVPEASGNGRIGDLVWKDVNGDGIQNNSEPGLSGIKVKLRSCNGIFVKATTTGSGGAYKFTDLPLDKYLVEFVLPSGAKFSPQRRGSKRGKDSDADPSTGFTPCVDLKTNADRSGVDAGIRL